VEGSIPHLDRRLERKVHEICLQWIQAGWIHSAHDCSEGGLAVAAMESCLTAPVSGPLGARLRLESTLRKDALLFGESQSRILISFAPDCKDGIEEMARETGVPFGIIGEVGGEDFSVEVNGLPYIQTHVSVLNDLWRESLGEYARQVS